MTAAEGTDPLPAGFPAVLRELLEAELAAENAIVEVAGSFPAPPVGAYVKLARRVTTRPRASDGPIHFYERRSTLYSGEWTDAKRYYFVLEPPDPPEPVPDLAAGRAIPAAPAAPARAAPSTGVDHRAATGVDPESRVPPDSCRRRFEASLVIDYEKWHDGIGYDLAALQQATAAEQAAIEDGLISRRCADWRDVEALAALGSERAKAELRRAFRAGDAEIRGAVLRYAPELVSGAERTAHLIEALQTAEFYGGLSSALSEASRFHPPEVVAQLLRGAWQREGEVAGHCAGLLLFIHGQAACAFDWAHRPFLLRFNRQERVEREDAFRELCQRIGADPSPYLDLPPSR